MDDKHNYLVSAYNLTAQAKIKGICEFVETLLENWCKFLIFGHHYNVLDAIEETVIKKKMAKLMRCNEVFFMVLRFRCLIMLNSTGVKREIPLQLYVFIVQTVALLNTKL